MPNFEQIYMENFTTTILYINKPAGFLAELLFRFNSNSIDGE